MPLEIFCRLCKLNKLSLHKLQNKVYLKVTPSGTAIKFGPYLHINETWVYVAELIRGDGHIPMNYWTINFVNKEETLINYVSDFFNQLGVPRTSIYTLKRPDATFLTIRSFVFAYLFSKLFNIPTGAKEEMHLPSFVLLNQRFMSAAVRGAFDAEGSVQNTGSRRIVISSNSNLWLKDLQIALEHLRVVSKLYTDTSARKKPIYRLCIFHKLNLIRFLKIVKPYHPKRIAKLMELLETYPGKTYVSYWRSKVLSAIKKGCTKRRSIAIKLKVGKKIIGGNLRWLLSKQLISISKKVWTNKGGFYEYKITKKGLQYLQNAHSFFN